MGNEWWRTEDMSECPCELEKTVDPWCCAAGMCAREDEMAIERAELGVDGNCGFALLGANIQEGEAEFEEIRGTELNPDPTSAGAAKQAINRAFARLKARVGRPISYFLGESHPDHC
jgi:hypothetical protein